MIAETTFRWVFLILLAVLLAMRFYFMMKVRRAGERLMPDDKAVARGVFIIRYLSLSVRVMRAIC